MALGIGRCHAGQDGDALQVLEAGVRARDHFTEVVLSLNHSPRRLREVGERLRAQGVREGAEPIAVQVEELRRRQQRGRSPLPIG